VHALLDGEAALAVGGSDGAAEGQAVTLEVVLGLELLGLLDELDRQLDLRVELGLLLRPLHLRLRGT
jgi:hypothetical protein